MKHYIVFIALILIGFASQAQGKFYNLDSTDKKPKTEIELIKDCKPTDNMAQYKGQKLIVYKTSTNKLFVVIKSKTGTFYRRYIKEEQ